MCAATPTCHHTPPAQPDTQWHSMACASRLTQFPSLRSCCGNKTQGLVVFSQIAGISNRVVVHSILCVVWIPGQPPETRGSRRKNPQQDLPRGYRGTQYLTRVLREPNLSRITTYFLLCMSWLGYSYQFTTEHSRILNGQHLHNVFHQPEKTTEISGVCKKPADPPHEELYPYSFDTRVVDGPFLNLFGSFFIFFYFFYINFIKKCIYTDGSDSLLCYSSTLVPF